MWKQRAATLCGCLAMLPLMIGCSNGAGGPPQAYGPPASYAPYNPAGYAPYGPSQGYSPTPGYGPSSGYASPQAYAPVVAVPADTGGTRFYAAGPSAPAAIVVMLPGPGDSVTANPQLWAAQGFDVVTPTPLQISQMVADQQAAAARLIAEAQAMADAPVWIVGPNPAIEATMASLPRGGPGQVAGIVVTSTSSATGTCSERMVYSYSGNGAPKVAVSKSGNACPPGAPFAGGTNSAIAPAAPVGPPHGPRLIEASLPAAAGSPPVQRAAAQRAAVQQIADLIKSPPG